MIEVLGAGLSLGQFSLKKVSLEIETGDYFILVGPTGSGKTVLLETIAGLHHLKTGEIRLNGIPVNNLEPEKRGISMVYQDCALFPHMTVEENVRFGLRVRRRTSEEISRELKWISELLGIESLLSRKPGTLSGGEKQKVSLARSLIVRPRVLLLDEPLSALDQQIKEDLQQELKRLHGLLGVTIIHVTHDFEEALVLGKHMAIIESGQIRQTGTPQEIYRRPNSEFVASFTLMRNIFPGEIVKEESRGIIFRTTGFDLVGEFGRKGATFAAIRPDDIAISTSAFPNQLNNIYRGTISGIIDKGSILEVSVSLPPLVSCLITRRDYIQTGLKEGQMVWITFRSDAVHFF